MRFNEALSVNKQLREEIDHLRRERVCNDGGGDDDDYDANCMCCWKILIDKRIKRAS